MEMGRVGWMGCDDGRESARERVSGYWREEKEKKRGEPTRVLYSSYCIVG